MAQQFSVKGPKTVTNKIITILGAKFRLDLIATSINHSCYASLRQGQSIILLQRWGGAHSVLPCQCIAGGVLRATVRFKRHSFMLCWFDGPAEVHHDDEHHHHLETAKATKALTSHWQQPTVCVSWAGLEFEYPQYPQLSLGLQGKMIGRAVLKSLLPFLHGCATLQSFTRA